MAAIGGGMKNRSEEEIIMMLENIEEWVEDEGRLVTYKWLSRTLGLHVNEAKDLLSTFVSRRKPSNDPPVPSPAHPELPPPSGLNQSSPLNLTVTYCLTGTVKQNGCDVFRLRLVREDEDKEKVEAEFLPPVSCHVYGVQKRTTLTDPHLLYSTDFDMVKKNVLSANEFSGVACPKAKLRTPEEMEVEPVRAETNTEQQPKGKPTKETTKAKDVAHNKSKSSAPVKATAASFFGNPKPKAAGSKNVEPPTKPQPDDSTSEPTTASKPSQPKSSLQPRNGGMTSLFKAAPTKSPAAEDVASEAALKTSSGRLEPAIKSDAKQPSGAAAKARAACVPSTKANVEDCGDDAPSKKRKRVVALISSSEDEDEEEEENMDIEVPEPISPPANVEPDRVNENGDGSGVEKSIKPAVEPMGVRQAAAAGCQTNRVLVSKTFVNAEGFIVTEKVYESQTTPVVIDCDMEASSPVLEVPAPSKPVLVKPLSADDGKTGKAPVTTKAQPKKGATKAAAAGKQQSMMTFFKKQ